MILNTQPKKKNTESLIVSESLSHNKLLLNSIKDNQAQQQNKDKESLNNNNYSATNNVKKPPHPVSNSNANFLSNVSSLKKNSKSSLNNSINLSKNVNMIKNLNDHKLSIAQLDSKGFNDLETF